MDSTRISIAQLLALDVPLVWQDAVAVAQEVAMLSEVTAAMNPHAALVTPDTCFLTRTGEIELPESTDHESPDAVSELLRLLLAGREAPEALEELAFGHHGRDMWTELAVFPIGNRRAAIARVATRALARLQERPAAAPRPPGAPPASTVPPPPVGPHLVVSAPEAAGDGPREWTRPVLVTPTRPEAPPPRPQPPAAAPPTVEPVAIPPPFRAMPPFRATPSAATATLVSDAPEVTLPSPFPAAPSGERGQPAAASAATQVAADREVRRLRQRHAQQARDSRRWSARFSALVGRFGRWMTWRPATPDPRLIGAGVVVTAAAVTLVWRGGSVTSPPAARADGPSAAVSVPAATSPPPPADALAPEADAVVPSPGLGPAPTAVEAAVPRVTARPAPLSARSTPARPERSAPGAAVTASTSPVPGPPAEPAHAVLDAPASAARAEPPPRSVLSPARPPVPAPSRARTGADLEASRTGDGLLYSADDRDVVPPVMRRQQLPSALLDPAMVPPEDWPILELLIDERGTVEQVRLHARQPAPGQTLYRHRMLLAAAKAWQFEPALRNGTPVRYVMRVPLEP